MGATTLRRRRHRGQTIIGLALLAGILMTVAALVIDLGTQGRIASEEQYVCDTGALAGIAEVVNSGDSATARQRVMDWLAQVGYKQGEQGVEKIEAWAYHRDRWSVEHGGPIDEADSDRYRVTIRRHHPTYFAGIIGVTANWVERTATAAYLETVPIDVSFDAGIGMGQGANGGSEVTDLATTTTKGKKGDAPAAPTAPKQFGFPTVAWLSQFGPLGDYALGDAFNMPLADHGDPNPTYMANGIPYDIYLPPDWGKGGNTMLRIELFDPDTINQGDHVTPKPTFLTDTDGDPSEPEVGCMDEIHAPPPSSNALTKPATFPERSTQTEFRLVDAAGKSVATASYGPQSNTPFWMHREAPASDTPHTAAHADPAQAQIATDLHWVTPQGFEFDTTAFKGPFRMWVKTVAGSSENSFSMRASKQRPHGDAFDPLTYGTTPSGALSMYAAGRVTINFPGITHTILPIANVPADTKSVTISNFDTEVGASSLEFGVVSYDAKTGQGNYPVLFPVNHGGKNVVSDSTGQRYELSVTGTRSPTKQWRTDTFDIPAEVVVPKTDGKGNLVYDESGNIIIIDRRTFEGGDVNIDYRAGNPGNHDTSSWECGYTSRGRGRGAGIIVLIR